MESQSSDNNQRKELKDNESEKSYIDYLEKKISILENKRQRKNIKIQKKKQEIKNLINEITHLKELPLQTGTMLEILESENAYKAIIADSLGHEFVVNVSSNILRENLMPGKMVALNQRNMTIIEILPDNIDPFIQAMELVDNIPDISYENIGGLNNQIQEVRETVELPLINPLLFKKVGIDPPKGVLFYGSPGTGKTLLAKAVAHETKATFVRIVGSELVNKFIGEGARMVRDIFLLAKKKAPTILFIDELDALAGERLESDYGGDREVNRTLIQLMAELDGFNNRENVRIIAATNRIDIIDQALLRPGRFDRLVFFPIPNKDTREKIFQIYLNRLNIEENFDLKKIINLTEDMTGADIKAICIEAGMFAIRDNNDIIKDEYIFKAINKIKDIRKINKEEKKIYS
ncbi:MAG: proteasome-activating nucleotidase [Candidatus Lokiarchaeota archaeon]|nr:proteasome-activating nucleotidase [Candidatus Lokiarchaeota archaeon]